MVKEGFYESPIGSLPTGWNVATLGSVAKGKLTYGLNAPATAYIDSLPQYIRITDITEDGQYSKSERASVNVEPEEKYWLQEGDIVLARTGASTGKSYLYNSKDGRMVYAGFLIKASVDSERYVPKFIAAQLRTARYWRWVEKTSMRSGQPGINGTEYSSYLLPIPNYEEQQAIATALSDVDGLIVNLEKLIEKKKAIKQGTMHDLLNGKKRLPGFTEQWKSETFGNLCVICRGGSPRPIQAYLTTQAYGINWIKIGDVKPNAKYITSTQEKIIEAGAARSRRVYKGDFILSNSMSFGRPYILKLDGCIHDGWLAIQEYQKSFDTDFLYYLLGADYVFEQYIQMAAGSSVQNLNKEKVAQLIVCIPPVEEQKAIASILSDMDSEINRLEGKLDKYRMVKQGMMQKLLTGEIRLV